MNRLEFEAEMKRNGDTLETLAKKIGITKNALLRKKNGLNAFKQNEIDAIKKEYNLTSKQLVAIFFS